MASSWDSPGPKRKLEDFHRYSAYLYGVLALLGAVGLFISIRIGISIPHVVLFLVATGLSVAHLKSSAAVEQNKDWSRTASLVLACPLLLGFPIGTYMGFTLLTNALKYEPQ